MRFSLIILGVVLFLRCSTCAVEVLTDTVKDYGSCYIPNLVGNWYGSYTFEQDINIYNPDSNLFDFAIGVSFESMDSARPVSITGTEALNVELGWTNSWRYHCVEDGKSKLYLFFPFVPQSSDTVAVVRVELTYIGLWELGQYEICVDSSTLNDYSFMPNAVPVTEGVVYHTDLCYQVLFVPNCGIQPWEVPEELSNQSFCNELWYAFPTTQCAYPSNWIVTAGPGEILGGEVGMPRYSFFPGPEHAGQTFTVRFTIYDDVCGDGSFARWLGVWMTPDSFLVSVAPNAQSPTFPLQQTAFAAETGVPCELAPIVDDVDPCHLTYSYFWHWQDPEPPCIIDSSTGVLSYLGETEDTANHYIYIVVDEAGVKDTLNTVIRHWESVTCGDMDHNGLRNLTDLTLLVNFLFLQGIPPTPPAAGDVDCSGTTNLTDLTKFVNYLFLNKPDPCLNCP